MKESQSKQILHHLKSGYTLTPMDALLLFGCFRLGARIHDLKRKGYNIKTTMVEQAGKRFAEYSMKEGNHDD